MDPEVVLNDNGRRPPKTIPPSLSRLEQTPPNGHQEPVALKGRKRLAGNTLTSSSTTPRQVTNVDHGHRAAVNHLNSVEFRLRSRGTGLSQPRGEDRRKVFRFDTLSEDRSTGERQILLCAISNPRAICPSKPNATDPAMDANRSRTGEAHMSAHSGPAQKRARHKDSTSRLSQVKNVNDTLGGAIDYVLLHDSMMIDPPRQATDDEWDRLTASFVYDPPHEEEAPITNSTTTRRKPSTTHSHHMSEAFANRHAHCERTDYLNRGIWTWYGLNGSKYHPTSPPIEMYLVCNHGSCRRMDWRTVHGLHCHVVKDHQQPKGTIDSLEKALAAYGVPVRNIEEYESQPV